MFIITAPDNQQVDADAPTNQATYNAMIEKQFEFSEEYKYKISSTKYSSERYGACEVCKGEVSEVFYQSEQKTFLDHNNEARWTYYGCRSLFGHKECLISSRRESKGAIE